MTRLLIIAHAPLASALRAVAGHAFSDCAPMLEALDVTPDMSPEAALSAADELLTRLGQGEVLVLTDVFGATPCNVAQRLSDGQRVRVVTGVNVPMLWRTLWYVDDPLDSLVGRAVAGATQGVLQVAITAPQNQARRRNDQIHHDHQQ